jgi:AcrR family transcriptional regulator
MPRYVDHDARRRHIAATAAELVGTRGLEALTFRNVADAAGSSTTVLTHYFADKRDLLLSTFQAVAKRSGARFDEAKRRGGGLRECLEALLPLDAERQTEWRLLTCYWGTAVSDPGLAGEQARHVRSAQRRIESLLREQHPQAADAERQTEWRLLTCYWGTAVSDPGLAGEQARHVRSAQRRIESLLREQHPQAADAEREVVARRLITLVHGLGAHGALDPDHWSPAEQRRVLRHELGSLGALGRADGGEPAASDFEGPTEGLGNDPCAPSAKRAPDAGDRRRKHVLAGARQGPDRAARRRRRPLPA